jgi:cytochrome c oxidase subunit 3
MKDINRTYFQSHPYHLVEPSPWPISLSFSLLVLTVSAVMYMQGFNNGGYLLNLGTILTATGMALWFRDIVVESTYLGHHTEQVKRGITLGVALFILSELMAFFSIFWAYFHSSLSPSVEIGVTWPPMGITILDPFAIPLLNTILLLSSGAFITYAHHALIKGNRRDAILGIILTIIFAIIFTALQYYEYAEAGFSIADSVYGTLFFCSTGLHGAHVILGTTFIGVQFYRLLTHHHTKSHHIGMEGAIAYWHFVDVVWLFLYAFVYLWASTTGV